MSSFQSNPEVLIEILVVSLLGLVVLMIIAGQLAKRSGVGKMGIPAAGN